jgi:mannose-6-phosphate isomerase class I
MLFLEGTVHARSGIVIAEIQQTSDITYRYMILIESMHKGIQENFM